MSEPDDEKGGCGTGFVAAMPESAVETVVEATDGRVIGEVTDGESCVAVRGLELTG